MNIGMGKTAASVEVIIGLLYQKERYSVMNKKIK